ncbi:MAG: hypothetical protein LC745_10380 [Planctomycetia bacterium]|nr:hypothetical protein [Planctomycetia bacterium]
MTEYTTIRRMTVYAAARMEEELVAQFLKMGSTGYTVTECRGKGEHPVVDDPLGPTHSHVRIELLVQPLVADKVMAYLTAYHLKNPSIAACVESVEVPKTERY